MLYFKNDLAKEILGSMILKFHEDGTHHLPSPKQLQHKILIKGSNHVASHGELLDDMEEIELEIQKVFFEKY